MGIIWLDFPLKEVFMLGDFLYIIKYYFQELVKHNSVKRNRKGAKWTGIILLVASWIVLGARLAYKSDVNEKKDTQIDEKKLSEKLGCPVIKTVSTSDRGLSDVVKTAAELEGKGQKAPYVQGEINLHDKNEVEEADRKRFDFVNSIVKEVEKRKVLTKEKNTGSPCRGLIRYIMR